MMKSGWVILVLVGIAITSCSTGRHLTTVTSNEAPKAIGPYSHAIKVGNLVYTSGQIGISPVTNAMAGTDIATQTTMSLENLKAILATAGSDMEHVVKVTIFLKDMNDYAKVNEIYGGYFTEHKPARSTVQVAALPKNALIEIECVAAVR